MMSVIFLIMLCNVKLLLASKWNKELDKFSLWWFCHTLLTTPENSKILSCSSQVGFCGVVVITSALHAEGREFEPRQNLNKYLLYTVHQLQHMQIQWQHSQLIAIHESGIKW